MSAVSLQFDENNYDNIIQALNISKENGEVLQTQFECFLNVPNLNEEEKEWIKGHRDYLRSLEVAFPMEMQKDEPTLQAVLTTKELLEKWQEELVKQQQLLGELFHEVQHISNGNFKGDVPLTDGESRRLMASIKDILEGNRLELKDLRERKGHFQQLSLEEVKKEPVFEKNAKKGFFARLFGK